VTAPSTSRCPACGAAGPAANFCIACGAPFGAPPCPACGAAVAAGARFCGQCGAAAGSAPASPTASRRPLWAVGAAGAALLGLVLVLLMRKGTGAAPAVTDAVAAQPSTAAGTPPDISRMSPRERFDRLFNRIMRAAESGDDATVTRFTPMALMAYGQLPDIDADARYHAALLKVHTGDAPGAVALADTILAQNPGHLFGYVVRGTVARWQKDSTALKGAYAGFLAHYEAEMKAGRAEYGDHTRALDEFRQAAEGAKAAGTARGQ
jgi:hypothetical protein